MLRSNVEFNYAKTDSILIMLHYNTYEHGNCINVWGIRTSSIEPIGFFIFMNYLQFTFPLFSWTASYLAIPMNHRCQYLHGIFPYHQFNRNVITEASVIQIDNNVTKMTYTLT